MVWVNVVEDGAVNVVCVGFVHVCCRVFYRWLPLNIQSYYIVRAI
jgi:hypothetical protein